MLFYEKRENEKDKWLLILNSEINDADVFENQLEEFSKKYNLIIVNLPGFEINNEYQGVFSYDSAIEDINKILNDLKIKKIDIMGISLGSIVASKFCIKYPQKIEKIVLVEFMIGFSNIIMGLNLKFVSKLKKILSNKMYLKFFVNSILKGKSNKKYREMSLKKLLNMKKNILYSWIDMLNSYFLDYTDKFGKELNSLNKPKIYVVGKKDKHFIKKIEKHVQNDEYNKLVIIDGAGHICHISDSKILMKEVMKFLNEK